MFASFLEFALAVFCMHVCYMYTMYHLHNFRLYILFTYIGPGHVKIVDVNVFVEEERSQMKVTLRKVRLFR